MCNVSIETAIRPAFSNGLIVVINRSMSLLILNAEVSYILNQYSHTLCTENLRI